MDAVAPAEGRRGQRMNWWQSRRCLQAHQSHHTFESCFNTSYLILIIWYIKIYLISINPSIPLHHILICFNILWKGILRLGFHITWIPPYLHIMFWYFYCYLSYCLQAHQSHQTFTSVPKSLKSSYLWCMKSLRAKTVCLLARSNRWNLGLRPSASRSATAAWWKWKWKEIVIAKPFLILDLDSISSPCPSPHLWRSGRHHL